jgi:Tol biopolymer transport system component
MTPLPRTAAAVALLFVFTLGSEGAEKRPMKVDVRFAFKRVSAPQISPDGKTVVYQVTTVDLEKNKSSSALWLAPADGKATPKQLTDPKDKRDANPRWSPDGERILFESNRSGSMQLWVVGADGEVKQLTDISTGAGSGIWSPDGKSIAFVSSVYPEFSEKPFAEADKLNKEKDDAIEKSPVKAKTFTRLFYRHWDEYVGDKRQHLFVCTADGKDCRDVTPGNRDANPTSDTFSSGSDFTFSPDGKFLVFTAVPEKDEAWSTNYDVCRVSIDNKSTKWEALTADNKAADSGPKFSANGKKLAWRAQKKAGYEADKWDILVADCKPDGTLAGKPFNATAKYDVSVSEFC